MKHALALALGALWAATAGAQGADGVKDALANEHIGLLDTAPLKLVNGKCTGCTSSPQSLWYFQDDLIAVPARAGLAEGISPNATRRADVTAWSRTPQARELHYPDVTWIGASKLIDSASIDRNGTRVMVDDGSAMPFAPVPRIASNLSYANASTYAWLSARKLRMRGELQTRDGTPQFVARTIWPADYAIDANRLALQSIARGTGLKAFVRDQTASAGGAVSSQLVWERTPGAGRQLAGKPALGIMLNGAQGDDDESLAGHFGIATGRFGAHGEWADWAVNNFYNLDSVSEKGIIAATLPMDNYLTDLNSGQQYYRPSWMLVAVLKDARTAVAYQGGVQRVMNHFYRHDFVYRQAASNCAGVSIDVLRDLGWQVPEQGPTSRIKAVAAYGYVAATERSLAKGRGIYDSLSAEQTRLFPAVAFDAAGNDLLDIVSASPARALSPFEQQLKDDVEAIILVRIPQIPSSRAMGSSPTYSFDEYMQRTPSDHAKWKIVPVGPRPFPENLRGKMTAEAETPASVPLPVAGVGILGVAGVSAFWRRRKKSPKA